MALLNQNIADNLKTEKLNWQLDKGLLKLICALKEQQLIYSIADKNGKILLSGKFVNNTEINVKSLVSGQYDLYVFNDYWGKRITFVID